MKIQKSFRNAKNCFYVIPTPIGNLEDITIRTLNILKELDVLYCEDTRVTLKLLKKYDLQIKLKTYNDFSFEKTAEKILSELNSNLKVGLVSDAGMPGISDPGYDIIKYLKQKNQHVVILPGASAFVLPMVYATFGANNLFYGFLSKNKSQYKLELEKLMIKEENIILYETPHRLTKTLDLMQKIDSERIILVARELTKIYEEYIEGTTTEIYNHFMETPPKGEFVIVISPFVQEEQAIDYLTKIEENILEGMSTKDAVKTVADKYNLKKNKIYNEYLKEKNETD